MSTSMRAEAVMPRVADGTGRQLLAAVRSHPREVTPQFEFLDWCAEHEGVVRGAVGMALACEPWLSADGLGHVARWLHREGRSETADEALARFERARAVLADSPGQFARALAYLHTRAARRTPDRELDSYQWKHVVERHFEGAGLPGPTYVSNGALVAAAIAAGFSWGRGRAWPNAVHNISRKGPRA